MPFGKSRRLQELMERKPDLNWSSIARDALRRRMGKTQILKSLVSVRGLTVREVLQLDRKVKRAVAKKG